MAFWATSFIFNDIPCEIYGLAMYELDSKTQESGSMGGEIKIIEDRISRRRDGIDYGITNNTPLEFNVVFGSDTYLDRYQMSAIASWLTGHKEYKWLSICQADLENIRYRCKITELEEIHFALCPIAFSAKIVCDSPYAYKTERVDTITSTSSTTYNFYNESNINDYYYPQIVITKPSSVTSISVINASDSDREFAFTDLTTDAITITMDCLNQIITCSDDSINLYENFNNNFLRFLCGDNQLTVTGNCTIQITSIFPMNVGC